jgi:hypothetical protein
MRTTTPSSWATVNSRRSRTTAAAVKTGCTRQESAARRRAAAARRLRRHPDRLRRTADRARMTYIGSIDLRRIWIADEEKGLVFAYSMFRHPMEQKSITILNQDGTTSERPMNFNPFDLEAAHIFKISGGKIHEIEAMGFSLPLYSKNGWSQFTK